MSFTSKKSGFFANHAAIDFDSARQKLLSSNDLTDEEKALLNKISLQVHPSDAMYVPVPSGAQHYLSVGLSAVRCIEKAVEKSNGNKVVRSILDLPCGYGRVLRFLKISSLKQILQLVISTLQCSIFASPCFMSNP